MLGPDHPQLGPPDHAAVRDRVLGWSPGEERASFAIAPEIGLASLSGQSEGFDYSGTSESASFGAETGAGAWQAGLVASFTRTELHYQAETALAARGYRTGEHDTEILSLHPFAAWHAPSGGHFWASIGAGAGGLSHRDDLGFRSWSRSDVRLSAYAVGATVPVADGLSGALQAEAGIESFAFEIEDGCLLSSSLPTFCGRDYRAGLAWSASVIGAPSLSVAYRHLTGDGPKGGQLEARGSVSVAGVFNPRLTVTGNAQGSFGLGGGVRLTPGDEARGFGLDLDTRLVSLEDGASSDVSIRGEAGYGGGVPLSCRSCETSSDASTPPWCLRAKKSAAARPGAVSLLLRPPQAAVLSLMGVLLVACGGDFEHFAPMPSELRRRVLLDIRAHPGTTTAQVCERLGEACDRNAVSKTCRLLEKTGHIERAPHKGAGFALYPVGFVQTRGGPARTAVVAWFDH